MFLFCLISKFKTKKPFEDKNHNIKNGDKVYTSGKEGVFSPGIPVGVVKIENDIVTVSLFSDLSQITFINVDLGNLEKNK